MSATIRGPPDRPLGSLPRGVSANKHNPQGGHVRAKLLLALGLIASAPSFASEDAKTVIAAVESKYAGVTAMQASFVQTSHSQAFGDDKQSGNVVLKRPKQMFWDFGNKQFVTDGKTMWVYTADANQVIKYDNIGGTGSSADQLLTSLDQIDTLFYVTPVDDTSGHSFDLAPKKDDGQVKKVHLEMSNDLIVERVVITDSFDNTTELDFTNVKLNVDVPDSKFQFVVPAGAEVVSTGAP
jgi:outer membrane lipoprotein carrier protein